MSGPSELWPWDRRASTLAVQCGFVLLLAIDTFATVAKSESVDSPAALVGTHALALVSLLGLGVQIALERDGSNHPAVAVLPLLDLAALGLARIALTGTGSDVLAVLPALWLAREFSYRGAIAASLATVGLMSAPWMLVLGPQRGNISGAILAPLVVLLVGVVASWVIRHLQASHLTSLSEASSRQAAVAEAERQRLFNEAVMDTVDVGLVLLDDDGRYLSMNERHKHFMDLAFPDGHAGRAGQEGLVYDRDGSTPLATARMPTSRAAAGEEFDDQVMWVGPSQARRALSVSSRMVRDSHGRRLAVALAYTDVTELMQALAVKDDFVAMVSHELRTPLTSIRGYAQVLLEDPELGPRAYRQLGAIERNALRLENLVGDLLLSAHASSGALSVAPREVDVSTLVADSVRSGEPAAAAGGIDLVADVPGPVSATIDPARISQVLDNLISNAIKYSPEGGQVRVAVIPDGDVVEVSVTDEGIGISSADRAQLFTRFYRAREVMSRDIQGVGLGLSIAQEIVAAHGGRITVTSVLGEGSTFHVRLPRTAAGDRSAPGMNSG